MSDFANSTKLRQELAVAWDLVDTHRTIAAEQAQEIERLQAERDELKTALAASKEREQELWNQLEFRDETIRETHLAVDKEVEWLFKERDSLRALLKRMREDHNRSNQLCQWHRDIDAALKEDKM